MPKSPRPSSWKDANARGDPLAIHHHSLPYNTSLDHTIRSHNTQPYRNVPSSVLTGSLNLPAIDTSSIASGPSNIVENNTVEGQPNRKVRKINRAHRGRMEESYIYHPTDWLGQRLVNNFRSSKSAASSATKEELLWSHLPGVFSTGHPRSVWSKSGIQPHCWRWDSGRPTAYLKALDSARHLFSNWYDPQDYRRDPSKPLRVDFDEIVTKESKIAAEYLISQIVLHTGWTTEEIAENKPEIDRLTEYCSELLKPDLLYINREMAGDNGLDISMLIEDPMPIEGQTHDPEEKEDQRAWAHIRNILRPGTDQSIWSTLQTRPQGTRWGHGDLRAYRRALAAASKDFNIWYGERAIDTNHTKSIDENLQAIAAEDAIAASTCLMNAILFEEDWTEEERIQHGPEITKVNDHMSSLLTPIMSGLHRHVFQQRKEGLTSQEAIFAHEALGEASDGHNR